MLAGHSFRSDGRSAVLKTEKGLKAETGQSSSAPYFFPVFERRKGGRRVDESAAFIAHGGRARTDQEAAPVGEPPAGYAEEGEALTMGLPLCLN
jgi:hypothetical protein